TPPTADHRDAPPGGRRGGRRGGGRRGGRGGGGPRRGPGGRGRPPAPPPRPRPAAPARARRRGAAAAGGARGGRARRGGRGPPFGTDRKRTAIAPAIGKYSSGRTLQKNSRSASMFWPSIPQSMCTYFVNGSVKASRGTGRPANAVCETPAVVAGVKPSPRCFQT